MVTLIGSLGLKALWPLEQQAGQSGTTAAAELDADEQRALAMLDRHRRDNERRWDGGGRGRKRLEPGLPVPVA